MFIEFEVIASNLKEFWGLKVALAAIASITVDTTNCVAKYCWFKFPGQCYTLKYMVRVRDGINSKVILSDIQVDCGATGTFYATVVLLS